MRLRLRKLALRSGGGGWGARSARRARVLAAESRNSHKCHPHGKRVSAGEPGAMGLRVPMPGNGSRPSLSENGLRASGMTIPWVRQRVAGGGEPACDGCAARVRDAPFVRRARLTPRREGFGSFVAGWFSRDGFPESVARPSGQGLRRWRRVTLTRTAAGVHLEGCSDDRPEHRSDAQQRLHPKMDRRRGSTPVCAALCLGHGQQYAAGPEGVG